jgi:hypothetical protein
VRYELDIYISRRRDPAICVIRTLDEKPGIFIRDKPIFSMDRMLHKEYYRRSSAEKKSLVVGLKGA